MERDSPPPEPALEPRTSPEPGEGEDIAVEDEELVTVARFFSPMEAHLARTRLEAEGIEACVLEERLPPIDLLTGRPRALNRVAVRGRDAREAEAVLAFEPELEAEDGS